MGKGGGLFGSLMMLALDVALIPFTGGYSAFWASFNLLQIASFAAADISIGYMIGSYISPPGISGLGGTMTARASQVNISSCSEGIPIPELFGVQKLSGQIWWYGGFRSVPIKKKMKAQGKGGGMGSTSQIIGYNYYLTIAQNICMGPLDEIHCIYANQEVIWDGYLSRPDPLPSDGYSTIKTTRGDVRLYWGTMTQNQDSNLMTSLGTYAPYNRGIAYVILDDILLGTQPYSPTYTFVVGKYYTPGTQLSTKKSWMKKGQNPAHILASYMLMPGLEESYIDPDDLTSLQNALWNENVGMNVKIEDQVSVEAAITHLVQHIDAIVQFGGDLKFHMRLNRRDVEPSELPLLSVDDVLELPLFSRGTFHNTVNQINPTFQAKTIRERSSPVGFLCVGSNGNICKIIPPETIGPPYVQGDVHQDILGDGSHAWTVAFGLNHFLVGGGDRKVRPVDFDGEPLGSATVVFSDPGIEIYSMTSDGDTFLVVGVKSGDGVHAVLLDGDGSIIVPEKKIIDGFDSVALCSFNGDSYIIVASGSSGTAAVRVSRTLSMIGSQRELAYPGTPVARCLATDGRGYLMGYSDGSGNYVVKIDASGQFTEHISCLDGRSPNGMCFNGTNYLLIGADNNLQVINRRTTVEKVTQQVVDPAYLVSDQIGFDSRNVGLSGPTTFLMIYLDNDNYNLGLVPCGTSEEFGGIDEYGNLIWYETVAYSIENPVGEGANLFNFCPARFHLEI